MANAHQHCSRRNKDGSDAGDHDDGGDCWADDDDDGGGDLATGCVRVAPSESPEGHAGRRAPSREVER